METIMKTTIKNLSATSLNGLGEKKSQQLASTRALLALTLCLASSTSFNAGYCIDDDVEMDDRPQKVCTPERHAAREATRNNQSNINRPAAKVKKSLNDEKITNLPRFSVAVEQEGEGLHNLANHNYNLAFEEKTDKDFRTSSNDLKFDEDFQKLWDGVQEVDRRFNTPIEDKLTFLIGMTGSGKSAVYNYLQGINLRATKRGGRMIVDVDKGNNNLSTINAPYSPIAHDTEAETTFPCIHKGFADIAGFGDTRGPVQEIINAYSLYKLFENVQDFRIALVIPSRFHEQHYESLLKPLNHLAKIFNNNFESIKDSLNIIITKGDKARFTMDDFKASMSTLSNNLNSSNLTPDQLFKRKFYNFFSQPQNKQITFFDEPFQEGPLKLGEQLFEGNKYVHKIPPVLSLSKEAQFYAENLVGKISNHIHQDLDFFKNDLDRHVGEFIVSHQGTAAELREEFRNLDNPDKIIRHFDNSSNKHFYSTLSHLQGIRNFLDVILAKTNGGNNVGLPPRPIENDIRLYISQYVNKFSQDVIEEYDDGYLKLRGNIIGTSDISTDDLRSIHASEYLLIDEDVVIPGANITFEAPVWTVIGHKMIDLAGSMGGTVNPGNNGIGSDHHRDLKPSLELSATAPKKGIHNPTRDGKPGAPGKRGQDGGTFDGAFDIVYNKENLTVNVSGGNGGKGGKGGNGGHGQDGKHGSKDLDDCIPIIKPQENGVTSFTYISGALAERGGDGGSGGRGGNGGTQGNINLRLYTSGNENVEAGFNLIMEDGDEGKRGRSGRPGNGGVNGEVYQGVWYENSLRLGTVMTEMGNGVLKGGVMGLPSAMIPGAIVPVTIATGFLGGVYKLGTAIWNGMDKGWKEAPHLCLPMSQYAPNGIRALEVDTKKRNLENGKDKNPAPVKKARIATSESSESDSEVDEDTEINED